MLDLRKHTNQRRKHKSRSREEKQLALQCYLRSDYTQRKCRKWMIEIWRECASFQTTRQRPADQVRIIIKKGWFFWPWNTRNTWENMMNTIVLQYQTHLELTKKKQLKQNEPPASENGNATQPNNARPYNPQQILIQEQKVNLESLKGIINGENTILLSLSNRQWRTVKTKMNKINHVLPYISMNNVTELNKLVNARVKLVWEFGKW